MGPPPGGVAGAAGRDYGAALRALGGLISGRSRPDVGRTWEGAFGAMGVFLERLGISEAQLRGLSVIHVAGTKGKGSTCAMAESILRRRGYRTGLFTSPHLVDVRERIRVDGRKVREDIFLSQFWRVWDRLERSQTPEVGMPAYFRFLTLLGYTIFLEQEVDVAVVEVGLGGRLDATNILPAPRVCGIASLGMDHTELLGDTLGQIAREKAGILRPGVPAFSTPQEPEAWEALRKAARAGGTPLAAAPALSEYRPPPGGGEGAGGGAGDGGGGRGGVGVGLRGGHQEANAALAVALCRAWERRRGRTQPLDPEQGPGGDEDLEGVLRADRALPPAYVEGLQLVKWPGRSQVVERAEACPGATFHLDGAHTPESLGACVEWFASSVGPGDGGSGEGGPARVALLFHCMKERDPAVLLGRLVQCLRMRGVPPELVVFCGLDSSVTSLSEGAAPDLEWQETLRRTWEQAGGGGEAQCTSSIQDGVAVLRAAAEPQGGGELHVLVTGSLYLVGDMLKLLDRAPE